MTVVVAVLLALRSLVRSRASLQLENLALRPQLQVLERSRPRRPRLSAIDRLLGVAGARVERMATGPHARATGHRDRVAPTGLSSVLDLEEPAPYRPSVSIARHPSVDPDDVPGESALGCAARAR